MADTPETKAKKKLTKWLDERAKSKGTWWTSLSDRYRSGIPDRMEIEGGRITFYEVKSMEGRLTALQDWTAHKVIAAGAKYFIVRIDGNGVLKFKEMC